MPVVNSGLMIDLDKNIPLFVWRGVGGDGGGGYHTVHFGSLSFRPVSFEASVHI